MQHTKTEDVEDLVPWGSLCSHPCSVSGLTMSDAWACCRVACIGKEGRVATIQATTNSGYSMATPHELTSASRIRCLISSTRMLVGRGDMTPPT